MELTRKKNAEHASISGYLDKKGIWYANSYTNFLFFPAKADAAQVLSKLEEKGIGIRVWEYNNLQWFRISIGTWDEMKTFTKAFDRWVERTEKAV